MKTIILLYCYTTASTLVAGTVVNLNFDTLPSAQGFTFTQAGPHADESESDLFSVTDGSLLQTTVGTGQGANSPGNAGYRRDFTTLESTAVTNFRLDLTARVTSHENTRQDFSYAAFTHNIYVNNEGLAFGIKPTELAINGIYFTPVGFDGTLFHDYRIDADLVNNTYEFFLDGVSTRTGSIVTSSGSNYALLGDGTGTGNSNGARTKFTVATNVPEPSLPLLALLGSLSLLGRRRV